MIRVTDIVPVTIREPDPHPVPFRPCAYCGEVSAIVPRECCIEGFHFDSLYAIHAEIEARYVGRQATQHALLMFQMEVHQRLQAYCDEHDIALATYAELNTSVESYGFRFLNMPTMITKEQFTAATGREPHLDDLDRVNCDKAGQVGHFSCGWCEQHNCPRLHCGCLLQLPPPSEEGERG